MIEILTPAEMAAVDAAAPEPLDVLIGRAAHAVAVEALELLGGTYGRRVAVIAGRGNNGEDGRRAARLLAARGVRTMVVAPDGQVPTHPRVDLVIDAAYGTGFRSGRGWRPPAVGAVPVLAVDIPSGVDGATGEAIEGVLCAERTVTFAALKPGLLFGAGRRLAGTVIVADIGLATAGARSHLVVDADVEAWVPHRAIDTHKWKAACWIVAGSPGMTGAAHLAARGAQAGGAGYVRLSTPGLDYDPGAPTEVVGVALPDDGWADEVVDGESRFGAVVVGPGLGTDSVADVRRLVARCSAPVVVDGDGLSALGPDAAAVLADRVAPTVLTPHDGEFERLAGAPPGANRLDGARRLAADLGAVVLLKGPTTVVASPHGDALVVTAGDQRLATAGTGDVLSGLIGAFVSRGAEPLEAAAAAAHVHGRAARLGPRDALTASRLVELVPRWADTPSPTEPRTVDRRG